MFQPNEHKWLKLRYSDYRKDNDIQWLERYRCDLKKTLESLFTKRTKDNSFSEAPISLGWEFISKSRRNLFLLGLAYTLHSQDSFITAIHVFLEFNMSIWFSRIFFLAHTNLRIDWLQTCNAFLLVIYTVECACRLYVERSMYVSQPSGRVGGRFFWATAPKKWEMLSHWVVTFMKLWPTNTPLKVRVRFVFGANQTCFVSDDR